MNPLNADEGTEEHDSVSADNKYIHCRQNHIIRCRLFPQSVINVEREKGCVDFWKCVFGMQAAHRRWRISS